MTATPINYRPITPVEGNDCPEVKKRPNVLIRIITKIWNAIKGIFKWIGSLFKSKPKLSEAQKERFKHALSDPKPRAKRGPKARLVPLTTSHDPSINGKGGRTELPPIENPVMRDFHQSSQKFMSHVLDCAFDEKVAPVLQENDIAAGLARAADVLKFAADLSIGIGDSAAKPIFEKLADFNVEEAVRPELNHLLTWVLKDGIKDDFRARLKDKMGEGFDDTLLDPCIAWLNSTRGASVASHYPPGQDCKAIDQVFQKAVLLLVENKIEALVKQIKEKIGDKLPEILKKSMIDNGMRISDIFIRRMITLLEHSPHKAMFNDLTQLTLKQTQALIQAENKIRNDVKEARTNSATCEVAKAYKARVDAVGEEQWIKQEIAKEYSTHLDGEMPFCNPQVAELINYQNLEKEEKLEIEEGIFETIADRLIPLLLPKQHLHANGEDHEVDSLVYLLDQIELPPEFKELLKDAVDISKEILSPKVQAKVGSWYHKVVDLAYNTIEEAALDAAKKGIKKGVMIGLNKFFEQFITLNSLNELTGTNILPALREQMYISLANEEMAKHSQDFSTLFDQLSRIEDAELKQDKLKAIALFLRGLIKPRCNKSADRFNAITNEDYFSFMVPELESIHDSLTEGGKKPVDLEKLKKLGESIVESDPTMEVLMNNIFFGLGKFRESEGVWNAIVRKAAKGPVKEFSQKIVGSTKELRSSPDYLVKVATKQINKQFGTKEAVKEQFFDTKEPVPKEVTEARLQAEIKDIADLAYDGLSFISRKALAPSELNDAITNIYQRMFGNRLVTQNFLVKAQEVVLKRLGEGAKRADEAAALNPLKVSHIPTILPELLTA